MAPARPARDHPEALPAEAGVPGGPDRPQHPDCHQPQRFRDGSLRFELAQAQAGDTVDFDSGLQGTLTLTFAAGRGP